MQPKHIIIRIAQTKKTYELIETGGFDAEQIYRVNASSAWVMLYSPEFLSPEYPWYPNPVDSRGRLLSSIGDAYPTAVDAIRAVDAGECPQLIKSR